MGHVANIVFFSGIVIGGGVCGIIAYKLGFRAGKNAAKDNK